MLFALMKWRLPGAASGSLTLSGSVTRGYAWCIPCQGSVAFWPPGLVTRGHAWCIPCQGSVAFGFGHPVAMVKSRFNFAGADAGGSVLPSKVFAYGQNLV